MTAVDPALRFDSILVANRGEIAVRVIRTARALGYRTVAIHSDADAGAPHVAAADDAALVGPAPPAASYLHVERILAAAKASGAGAVHPGYGFLSENADFARECERAGLVFIGPPPDAIDAMGNKAVAKRRMVAAGVPCVPGYQDTDQSDDAFCRAAERIGFPVMVKAAAGGGGRGMRLVGSTAELVPALSLARSEAQNAFGSAELILEKALVRPRHVEVQVFADAHGNVVHLAERDCSMQRRHQKVIEEAPCPVMTDQLRSRMGAAAVEAARSIGYRGAGTVEFLLAATGEFYFLEMNTRLQVEHPVTEMISGLDLVALQIRVARGEPLGFGQEDLRLVGHAIEARLYAEDPSQGFLPSTGRLDLWVAPSGDGIRVDAGVVSGSEVSPFYDPMLAKIIAWGESREAARRRLIAALRGTVAFGPKTNRGFLISALSKDAFARGDVTTAFIAEQFPEGSLEETTPAFDELAIAAVMELEQSRSDSLASTVCVAPALSNWCSTGRLVSCFRYDAGGARHDIAVSVVGPNDYLVTDGAHECTVRSEGRTDGGLQVVVDGRRRTVVSRVPHPGLLHVAIDGRSFTLRNLVASAGDAEEAAGGGGRVLAPMHGMLIELSAAVGDTVRKGDRLAVLEAMKMQHEILAKVDGTVRAVLRKAGEQVAADDALIELDTEG